MKSRIFVVGSINMDIVLKTEDMPKPGETVRGKDLHFIPGGKGSNQAVAASRLNGDVYFIGRLGDDAFGRALHDFLKKEHINLEEVKFVKSAPTGTAMILLDKNSQNSIVFVAGANSTVSPDNVSSVKLTSSDIVLSQFEVPLETVEAFFKKAKQVGAKTVLNPAPVAKCSKGLMSLVDYLIVNEHEVAFFAGGKATTDLKTIAGYAKTLRSRPDQTIIVTLGEKGAFCLSRDKELTVSGIKVNAIDTTGAGDCFAGAFTTALAESKSIQDALNFANKAASISVTRLGAATSLPTRSEVEA